MEKAILFTDFEKLNESAINPKYKRVYFGTEFCQKLIPEERVISKVLKFCKKNKLSLTLLTPFVTDSGLNRLDILLDILDNSLGSSEVVVNDWGVLDLIKRKYKNIEPVLGRLMFGQKRDPRLMNMISGTQKGTVVNDYQGQRTIFLPKNIPQALKEVYKRSNVTLPEIINFLSMNRIKRVEFDNLLQGLSLDLPRQIRGSVYVPFGCISVTRLCPMLTEVQKKERITVCKKECKKYFWKMRAIGMPKIIYKKGAALFYKNSKFNLSMLKEMGIDRIIYEPELPI